MSEIRSTKSTVMSGMVEGVIDKADRNLPIDEVEIALKTIRAGKTA